MKLIFTDGYEQREFNNQIKKDLSSFEVPFLWSDVIASLLKIGLFIIWNIMIHESFQSGRYNITDCKNNDASITFKGRCLIRTMSFASHYCPVWSTLTYASNSLKPLQLTNVL